MKNLFIILFILAGFYVVAQDNNNGKIPEGASILSEYIRHKSLSGNEGNAGKYIRDVCIKKNLFIRTYSEDIDSYNFAASVYPLSCGKPNIVFLNHIDVVPANDSAKWKFNPFAGIIHDSCIWGRGALDDKGIAIMELMAVCRYKEISAKKDLPYNVTVLFVSGEENGSGKGARIVCDNYLKELNPCVMFGEGGGGLKGMVKSNPDKTVFGISTAQKSLFWLKLSVKNNTAGHGSITPEAYANKKMIMALNKLVSHKKKIIITPAAKRMFYEIGKLEGGFKGFCMCNIVLLKPFIKGGLRKNPMADALLTNSFTVTNMRSDSGAANQISQSAEAILDCRLLPETKHEDFVTDIKRIIKDDDIKIDVILKAEDEVTESKPDKFFRHMADAILKKHKDASVIPLLFPAYSDNDFFRRKGVPVFGISPILLNKKLTESFHNTNEHMPFTVMEEGIETYTEFLNQAMEEKR